MQFRPGVGVGAGLEHDPRVIVSQSEGAGQRTSRLVPLIQLTPGVGVGLAKIGTVKWIGISVINGGGVEDDVEQGVAITVVLHVVDSIRFALIGISIVKQLVCVL